MAEYHILTKSEVSDMFQRRLRQHQKTSRSFIKERWGSEKIAPPQICQSLISFLTACDIYNSDTPAKEILKGYTFTKNDVSELPQLIHYHTSHLRCHDKILSQTIRSGRGLRQRITPYYPPIFANNSRIYIKVPTISGHPIQIDRLLQRLNSSLTDSDKLISRIRKEENETYYFIATKSSEQPIGRFLSRKIFLVNAFLTTLRLKSPSEISAIEQQIKSKDFYQFSTQRGHIQKVDWLKRDHHLLLDPILFSFLQHHLKTTSKSIPDTLHPLLVQMENLKSSISFEQDRQGDDEGTALVHDTDLIILSKAPVDIARCSAYTDYEELSCMNPYGFMHQYVHEDIGRGTLVAYMVHSSNPHKRFSRILLKPYLNDRGEPIYHIGKTHGEKNFAFHQFLKNFARDCLNTSRTATYTINPYLYPDGEPQQLVYSPYLEVSRC